MGQPNKHSGHKFTYKDYLAWPEEEQWELIDGIPYSMTPAPSTQHQKVVTILVALFYNAFKGSPCQVFGAPFDVRLPEKDRDEIISVVQPDLTIVCDRDKLDDKGCLGSPDLIVEVTSPSTLRKDIKEKFHLYEKAGVKQYWIIYLEQKTVVIFKLDKDGRFGRPDIYGESDTIQVKESVSISIDLAEVFADF
ncbi:Uma2 family endonuclease [Desulfitobacterium hafniense]|uniref:Uma2 family endonuclease n=1 Tax=Desulfitobacterium hafniense TaxID=49338 RepID=UPI0003649586|nr:Uma2 family endonuclease [Desulfitobacterium hafniense]